MPPTIRTRYRRSTGLAHRRLLWPLPTVTIGPWCAFSANCPRSASIPVVTSRPYWGIETQCDSYVYSPVV
jgi:hypothetical protein